MTPRLIVTVLIAALVSCTPSRPDQESVGRRAGEGCYPAGPTYQAAMTNALRAGARAKVLGNVYAIPSRTVKGVWILSTKVDGSVAVWTTDADPAGGDLGVILVANPTARKYSDLGMDVPSDAPAPVARAREDSEAIRAAEACPNT